jgi:hypothetical protein
MGSLIPQSDTNEPADMAGMAETAGGAPMSDYYDLGDHHRPISTSSAEAQLWFDRGLIWTYGFNHEEAVRCFERAIEADPDCPMAHWGAAYAAGPNYNKPWKFFNEEDLARTLALTHAATAKAVSLLEHASPAERALITALQSRYQSPDIQTLETLDGWTDDYAGAMRAVYRDYGADLDVTTLFAESLMNRTPWQLWDLPAAAPAEGASTVEAMEVLERALASPASHRHPGALHMYIHLMEMSPFPERALRAGDRLRALVPIPGIWRICRPISTCSAGTTTTSSTGITPRSSPTASSWSATAG